MTLEWIKVSKANFSAAKKSCFSKYKTGGDNQNGIDADISLGEITDLLVLWNSDAAALSSVEDNSDNGSKSKNNQHANYKNYL